MIQVTDPKAGIITEAAAAITGFEGAGAIAERLEKKEEGGQPAELARLLRRPTSFLKESRFDDRSYLQWWFLLGREPATARI